MTLKAQSTNAKVGNWNCIKLNSFHTAKEVINRVNSKPIDWEKIFVKHKPDKRLISKIFKELI